MQVGKKLKVLGVLAASLLAVIFSITPAGGKNLEPEKYFTGKQLEAYKLAQQGETEQLLNLVKTGVNVNTPGQQQLTLLGLAVITAHRQAIINLMRAGADPNQVIPDAGSPAVFAISMHYTPPKTAALEALLDAGYNPNQILSHGTPYMFFFADFNHWPGLKLALRRGGDVNVRRSNGESLLTYVIEGGDYAQARELVDMGADVAARGTRGETPLKSIEFKIKEGSPNIRSFWKEVLSMRELILSKLTNPEDRRSFFTDAAEEKIRLHPLQP
ncbi:ankyrin repeat domain-containing protein [Citrifermentans bremense]|uniref:ankyrin repeat domain-containing protein n=1 Tax=Citrifermentans bremense TaxID=60035 RepID=UPI00047D264B|nr:ankyrin repeat domain-containing protein [Citrifermentans bremense]